MTELIKIDTEMVGTFGVNIKDVQKMVQEYQKLSLTVGDKESYGVCRAALTTCVRNRTSIDKRRKELNEEDQARIKKRNGVAKQLTELISPAESHLTNLVKGEDNRIVEIKAEKERMEFERIKGIRTKIADIASLSAAVTINSSVEKLNNVLTRLDAIEIIPDEYMELTSEANQVKHDVHIDIQRAILARKKFDAEDAARVAENERLAKERDELEKVKAEQEARQKSIDDAAATLDAEKERMEREEFERKAKENAQEKLLWEQKEKEDREKAEAEERARVKALEPDKSKLGYWLERIEIAIDEKPEGIGQEAKELLGKCIGDFDQLVGFIRAGIKEL